ncbi:pentatricopeptide repeat-containing protein [Quercus suber]|uniref:Pentatricopeptide repeat-containing protein n=1 Tax=Quercus suber TaxID=58331 RepID=A0AAW0KD63_QUESU
MSIAKLLKIFNKATTSLLSNLNSHIIHLVLSNPHVPPRSCLSFFKFLQKNQSLTPQKPDLRAHVTLVCRLYGARKFTKMKNILICIVADDNLQCPVSIIVSLIEEDGFNEPKFVVKLCDMLMRVYSDNRMCEEAVGVFDYMEKNGFEIEERSCFVLLLALKKCDRVESCFEFFRQMVESDVEITVYAMTSVIDGLCRRGEVERGRELMAEIVGRGIKPNIEEANKLSEEMCKKGIKADVHVYTSIISWNFRLGNMKKAFVLFDELNERDLVPNVHTYGALINGSCKAGQMEL